MPVSCLGQQPPDPAPQRVRSTEQERTMQPARERKAEAGPVLPREGSAFAEEPTGLFLASPGGGGSAPRPRGPPGSCPSGRGFLKRRLPFLLKRKEPLQGQAASRSRLCAEDAHESPIQAFRRAAPRGQPRTPDSDDGSAAGAAGPSLLRKLLCLTAGPSERPPLRQAGGGCGPVAALSRTADPHGESPLRWKRSADAQGPPEAAATPEPERAGPGGRPRASCATRPWRAFRALVSSRARKGSVLPGREGKAGPGPQAPPAPPGGPSSRGQPSNQGAPRTVSPPDAPCGIRKEGEGPWRGPELRGQAGGLSEPAPEEELGGCSEEDSQSGEEMRGFLRRQASDGSAAGVAEAEGGALEDSDPEEQGGGGCWAEGLAGGDLDLADLAENPGGQGMVMGTRDLRWLTNELLGGPPSRPGGWRPGEAGGERPGSRGGGTESRPLEEERPGAGGGTGPVSAAQRSSLPPAPPCETSGGLPQEPDPPASGKLPSGGSAGQPQGSPARTRPVPEESRHAAAPEGTQSQRQLYRAAAEVVGAAIDAAAAQLAQKEHLPLSKEPSCKNLVPGALSTAFAVWTEGTHTQSRPSWSRKELSLGGLGHFPATLSFPRTF